MRIEDIQYLMSAISKQSMSKAAEEEFLSQQNITNAVKRLEKELGVQLVHRSNRGITLTNHGKILQPYLNQILLSYSYINTYIQNLEDNNSQTKYNIACLSALSSTLIEFVKNMSLYYPNTELSVIEYVDRQFAFPTHGRSDKNYYTIYDLFNKNKENKFLCL